MYKKMGAGTNARPFSYIFFKKNKYNFIYIKNQEEYFMLKGHLTIEVFDKDGKLKQKEEGDNIITNYSRDWMNICWTNPIVRMAYPTYNPVYASDIIENFRGILLFKELCSENKDIYFTHIMVNTVVGHADSLGISSNSNQYGILNETESEITENSITRVWNFGQGKAVGKINSVALCDDILGRKGTDDEALVKDTYTYIGDTSRNNKEPFSGGTLQLGTTGNYQPEVPPNDSSFKNYNILDIRNGIIYGYDFVEDNTNKKTTINLYKCDTSKYYKKQNFNNDFRNNYPNNEYILFVADGNSPFSTYTVDSEQSPIAYYWTSVFKNKFYFMRTVGNKAVVVTYDLATNTWSGRQFPNTKLASVNHGFALDDRGVICLISNDRKKIWRFTSQNFIFQNEIEISDKLLNLGEVMYIRNYNDRFIGLTVRDSSANTLSCLTNFTQYKCFGYGEIPRTYTDFSNLIVNYNNALRKNNINLSTIKNLKQPVVKGENDEMRVTYKIIKTNE